MLCAWIYYHRGSIFASPTPRCLLHCPMLKLTTHCLRCTDKAMASEQHQSRPREEKDRHDKVEGEHN